MTESPTQVEPTERTQVRRHRERGTYERAEIDGILDEGMIAHVAVTVDGSPWMIPTAYGRDGDVLYLHGAAGNHLLKAATGGGDIVVTVSLLDGVVLARSTFHHSLNFRSVVVFGRPEELTDPDAKAHALTVIVDHLLPGRSSEARPPTVSELRQTRVLALPIDEVSAKVRTGGPIDDEGDVDLPVWAGVLPLHTSAGAPVPDPGNRPGIPLPAGASQPARWATAPATAEGTRD